MKKFLVPYHLLGELVIESESLEEAVDKIHFMVPDKELFEGVARNDYCKDDAFSVDSDAIAIYEDDIKEVIMKQLIKIDGTYTDAGWDLEHKAVHALSKIIRECVDSGHRASDIECIIHQALRAELGAALGAKKSNESLVLYEQY